MDTSIRHWPIATPALLALLLLTACAGQQADLAGTSWALEQDSEFAQVSGLGITSVTLTFIEDGSLTGTHAYLKYAARYTVEGDALAISEACWTSMACQAETGLAAQQSYLDALMTAEHYSIEGSRLIIGTAHGDLVFRQTDVPDE